MLYEVITDGGAGVELFVQLFCFDRIGQQFLARQGVAEDRLAWQTQAGTGPELELRPLN